MKEIHWCITPIVTHFYDSYHDSYSITHYFLFILTPGKRIQIFEKNYWLQFFLLVYRCSTGVVIIIIFVYDFSLWWWRCFLISIFFLFSNWRFETDEKKKLAQTTNPASWLVDPSRRTNWSLERRRRREQKNRRREFRYHHPNWCSNWWIFRKN